MKSNYVKCDRKTVSRGKSALMAKSIRRLRAFVFGSVAALLLFCGSATTAQTFRGTILGTVTDSSGAAVSGAKVTIKNIDTGLTREVTTGDDGSYAVPELPIGTYDVTVEKLGFQTSVTKGVAVEVAHDRRVDAELKAGQVTEHIEVSAGTLTQVETTNNDLGGSFVAEELVNLPINGRDYTKLLIMAPGTTGDPSGELDSPGSFGQFSTNGNRGRSNNFLLDGTDMNDSYRNIPAINQGGVFAIPSTILPVESIAELRVLSNSEAEYGRSSGSVVNIVTKSGTNTVHGSAFEYFRNDRLNARNFFNTVGPKDAFRNNQFGGSLGGPIVKDKTFWYLAYEGQREGFGLTSLNTVPALSDYQAAVAAIPGSNPAACATDVFTCVTTQPAGVINPVIVNLYNLCHTNGKCSGGNLPWPLANLAGAVPGAPNNVGSDKARNDLDSVIAKVDHSFSPKETLTGRYFYGRSEQSVPLGAAGGNNLPNTNTFVPTDVHLVSISLVSVVSSNTVNEGRFGLNRFHEDFLAQDRLVFGNPNTSIGLDNGLGSVSGKVDPRNFGLPQMTFGSSGLSSLGSSRFSNPRSRIDRNYHFLDNFSWKLSRHDIKFGYEYRYTSIDSLEDINFRGRLKFSGLQGFLQGNVTGGNINYGDTTRNTLQGSHALYLQDSIRVSSRLTANLGLRWDYYGVIHEANNHLSSYNPASGLFEQGSPYDKDLNNFAPRVSLAWDTTGKGRTVIRSGFSVFYDTFSHDFFTGQIYEATNNLGPAYNAIGSKHVLQGGVVGSPLAVGVPVFGALATNTTDASTISKLRTPYIYNYSFNIQQQLLPNTVLQVGYVGTAGRKLQRIRDINQPSQANVAAYDISCTGGVANVSLATVVLPSATCPVSTNVAGNFFPTAPRNFNNTGSTLVLPGQNNNAATMSALAPSSPFYLQQLETSSRSSYNSLQASLAMRNWHGWTQQINYNWSHSIDDASDGQDYVPHAGQPNDSSNPFHSNRGNSNFDSRHHFVWVASYSFPKWEAIGRMGEGWTVSSLVSIISGHPFEVSETNDDYDGSADFFGRPDLVAKPVYNYRDPTHFLNLSAFAVPCTLDGIGTFAINCLSGTRHFGTLGRNALLGPAFRQWDFSIVKETRLTERLKLEVHADLFNILNHVNFANPLWPSFFDDIGPFKICTSVSSVCPAAGRLQAGQFFPVVATADTGPGNPILGGGSPRSFQLAAKFTF
jgi:outer membrane receptor protein involved in Fe transport